MLTKMRYLLFGMLIAVLLLTGAAALAEDSDFVIENGILTKYNGTDTEVVVPNGVTEIGSEAFYNNTSIVRVVLPDGLKNIGIRAFNGCSGLKDINIPDTVKSIMTAAFLGCDSLLSIVLPDEVVVGQYIVSYCTQIVCDIDSSTTSSLASYGNYKNVGFFDYPGITFHVCVDSDNKILYRVVKYCGTAEEVFIPNGTVSIEQTAFSGCDSVKRIVLPDELISISYGAFYGCSNLEQINIPEGIIEIAQSSFHNCSKLSSLIVPEGVTTIGDYAFAGCTNLQIVNIPESVNVIGDYVFSDCSNLDNITIPEGVSCIGDYAFSRCSSLRNIALPNSIYSIGFEAFSGCVSLVSLDLPDEMDLIGGWSFFGCENLESISMPIKLSSIGEYAFWGCSSLRSISLPDDLISIGQRAFWGCSNLSSIVIPNQIECIEEQTFAFCSNLVSIDLPDNITSLEDRAFAGCEKLKVANLPDDLTNIGNESFWCCRSLMNIDLPNGLTSIGDGAFSNCSSLRSIILPNDISSIGENAFEGCTKLDSLTLPTSLTILDKPIAGSLYVESGFTSVVLPKSIVSLPENAFGTVLSTVYCYRNTYAAQWAIEGGYSVIYLDDFLPQDFTVISSTVDEILLDVGQSYDASQDVMIEPRLENQTYTLQLTSSNTSVAKVTGTTVEALAAGEATITVGIREIPDVTCQFMVTVCIPVEDFTLPRVVAYQADELYDALMDDQSKVWIVPENVKPAGAEPILKWEPMYNGSLVTYDVQLGEYYDMKGAEHIIAGMYTPVTLTATAPNGVSRCCRLYLYSNITDLRVTSAMTIMAGETAVPRVIAYLDGSLVSDVPNLYTLTSSNTEIVSITEEGQLAAHKTGTATITVKAATGSLTKTITVSVVQGDKLPADVKIIEAEAFMGSSLTGIIIPDGCTSIGSRAFANCTALVAVKIPASVTEIAADAFEGSSPIICTSQGSAAHTFAVEHSLPLSLP